MPQTAMSDPRDTLTTQAAARIAGHVGELQCRYPTALRTLKIMAGDRGRPSMPTWPEWCWLPMGAAAALVQRHGRGPSVAGDIARVAAVAQWELVGRHIVTPSADVADAAVPAPPSARPEDVHLPISRPRLLEMLGGACYYLVTPVPNDEGAPNWVYGTYIHLEHDTATDRTELRFLVDLGRGWDQLVPVIVHADQPTVAWSEQDIRASIPPHLAGPDDDRFLAQHRRIAWLVWPLLGALLDESAHLIGPGKLVDADPLVKDARLWQLTYERPRPSSV
ncbi:hypothetical protein [Nonomuraea sp. NPDC049400]|uniref:hypothetical protein n=1 Tax=Nonomuraea sp. NPDC049400 TaxID=3364352 RepID=UPI0037A2DBD8